jgi:hypothetical protein
LISHKCSSLLLVACSETAVCLIAFSPLHPTNIHSIELEENIYIYIYIYSLSQLFILSLCTRKQIAFRLQVLLLHIRHLDLRISNGSPQNHRKAASLPKVRLTPASPHYQSPITQHAKPEEKGKQPCLQVLRGPRDERRV